MWEGIAEESADADHDIDSRASQFGERYQFYARQPPAFALPNGTHAEEREDLGHIVPLGSHGTGAPDVDADGFGERLGFGHETIDDFSRQFLTDSPRRLRG